MRQHARMLFGFEACGIIVKAAHTPRASLHVHVPPPPRSSTWRATGCMGSCPLTTPCRPACWSLNWRTTPSKACPLGSLDINVWKGCMLGLILAPSFRVAALSVDARLLTGCANGCTLTLKSSDNPSPQLFASLFLSAPGTLPTWPNAPSALRVFVHPGNNALCGRVSRFLGPLLHAPQHTHAGCAPPAGKCVLACAKSAVGILMRHPSLPALRSPLSAPVTPLH